MHGDKETKGLMQTTYRFEYYLNDGRHGIITRTYKLPLNAAHRRFWRWLSREKRYSVRELNTTIADLQIVSM